MKHALYTSRKLGKWHVYKGSVYDGLGGGGRLWLVSENSMHSKLIRIGNNKTAAYFF